MEYREDDQFGLKTCQHCKYYSNVGPFGTKHPYDCNNVFSDFLGEQTKPEDTCCEWEKRDPEDKIVIYTDGSALANGSTDSGCGWAYKVIYQGKEISRSGSAVGATNNQMEMTAVLKALQSVRNKDTTVEIYSDSRYVVETLRGRYKIGANQELWNRIFKEKNKFREIRFLWIKGHAKNEHNNDVDRAANEAARRITHNGRGGGETVNEP